MKRGRTSVPTTKKGQRILQTRADTPRTEQPWFAWPEPSQECRSLTGCHLDNLCQFVSFN
jgi:hypothetical protein